jgi:tetratricopeptide (TPR) repeat protein
VRQKKAIDSAVEDNDLYLTVRRAEQVPNPDSMELYFQGMACFHRAPSPDALRQGQSFFERALALDPGIIEARVGLSAVQSAITALWRSKDRPAGFAAAESVLKQVLSVAPDHALAHLHLDVIQIHTNRADQGIGEFEQALALDRNLAAAHGFIGLAKVFAGRSEETEAHVQEALRLSPRDRLAHVWMTFAGVAKLHLGCDEEGLSRLRRAIEINQSFLVTHFYMAAALANLGQRREAHAAVEAGLALHRNFTVSWWRETAPSDNPIFLAQHARVIEGFRKAGVPEQ